MGRPWPSWRQRRRLLPLPLPLPLLLLLLLLDTIWLSGSARHGPYGFRRLAGCLVESLERLASRASQIACTGVAHPRNWLAAGLANACWGRVERMDLQPHGLGLDRLVLINSTQLPPSALAAVSFSRCRRAGEGSLSPTRSGSTSSRATRDCDDRCRRDGTVSALSSRRAGLPLAGRVVLARPFPSAVLSCRLKAASRRWVTCWRLEGRSELNGNRQGFGFESMTQAGRGGVSSATQAGDGPSDPRFTRLGLVEGGDRRGGRTSAAMGPSAPSAARCATVHQVGVEFRSWPGRAGYGPALRPTAIAASA